MQLRIARLCLDCDEVHSDYECPICASERFAFLTRWVPAEERRQRPRPAAAVPPSPPPAPEPGRSRWVTRGAAGAAGLAVFAASRWLLREARANGSKNVAAQPGAKRQADTQHKDL